MPADNVVTGATIESEWGNDVANSITAIETQLTDATAAATANKLIKRDAAGRAQVATPSADSDIATKGWVEDDAGTNGWSTDTLVRRDVNGRAEIATPELDNEITNKWYVDSLAAPNDGQIGTGGTGIVKYRRIGDYSNALVFVWVDTTNPGPSSSFGQLPAGFRPPVEWPTVLSAGTTATPIGADGVFQLRPGYKFTTWFPAA